LEPAESAREAVHGYLPAGLQPQMGTDYSPVGQIYWYTLKSTNPKYDLMELKSLEDWTLEKQFKSVPDVVDVVSFGGTTREYQVRVSCLSDGGSGITLSARTRLSSILHQHCPRSRREDCCLM